MRTYLARKELVERKWVLVDVTDQVLGRVAVKISNMLRGKHRPTYTPHVDTGDFVVVTNAEKIRLTGDKEEGKIYYQHSGFTGGLKTTTARELKQKDATILLRKAVQGMLPKNRLSRKMLTKLKIFVGPEHPHEAQKPEIISLN
jgi:large subunit ribosomal protein L13